MNEPVLHDWLEQAWDEHDAQARRIADELMARGPGLPDDADGAEALRLAEHVTLVHLQDPPALQRLLGTLPAHPALAAAVQRARWALAVLAGEPEPPTPDSARWLALQSVVPVLVGQGRADEARSRLLAPEAAAADSRAAADRRAYAISANNIASGLRTGPRGDAARDALMIEAAELARRAWERAGTWMNVERADYQLALCHAALGHGTEAVACAARCLARCEAEGADAAERFFAHECCVQAERAAGNGAAAAQQRERMAALLPEIADEGMRRWCEETLAKT